MPQQPPKLKFSKRKDKKLAFFSTQYSLIQMTTSSVPPIQAIMKVNLTGLSFEMKEQTRPIQILKKKIVMMLMKEIWKKNRLR